MIKQCKQHLTDTATSEFIIGNIKWGQMHSNVAFYPRCHTQHQWTLNRTPSLIEMSFAVSEAGFCTVNSSPTSSCERLGADTSTLFCNLRIDLNFGHINVYCLKLVLLGSQWGWKNFPDAAFREESPPSAQKRGPNGILLVTCTTV